MLNILSSCISLPDFDKKLAAMGFEISDGTATYSFNQNNQKQPVRQEQNEKTANQLSESSSGEEKEGTLSSGQRKPSSATKQPSSIYRLVSKKGSEEEKPVVQRHTSSSSLKKVTFQDHNTSSESEVSTDLTENETADETGEELDHDPHSEDIQSETQESFDDSFDSNDDSSIPESYRGSRQHQDVPPQRPQMSADEDDVSMSAFVPASVRRESVLPNQPYNDTSSMTSEDSFEYDQKANYRGSAQSSSMADYQSRADRGYQSKKYDDQSTDESDEEGHKGEIDDLLDEAMDEVPEVQMRPKKEPVAAPVRYFGFLMGIHIWTLKIQISYTVSLC